LNTLAKINFLLDAIEDGEVNFNFDESKFGQKQLNRTLNRLRQFFTKEKEDIEERERYFGKMLDGVQSGVIAYDTEDESVLYSNKAALSMLGFSGLSSLRQVGNLSEEVLAAFREVSEGSDSKASFYSESSLLRISISASIAEISGHRAKLLTFNDISKETEDRENESWIKLIRVLTHEIMNTVAPIASLSEALEKEALAGKRSDIDLKEGLSTISESSRRLIKFVESYRSLTHVAQPMRKAFYVKDMVANVIKLTQETEGAAVAFEEKTPDVLLYADQDQLSQVLINLIRNARQAGSGHIWITADIDPRESVLIEVGDDGSPVPEDAREEIFVPFFTTKPSGTGIGLSLSRQIVRVNGGTLRLSRSDAASTVFSLLFR